VDGGLPQRDVAVGEAIDEFVLREFKNQENHMKRINLVNTILATALLLVSAGASRADTPSLNVVLSMPSQTVVEGTTVVAFDATISNPSMTETIFLNSATATTSSTLVLVDPAPFYANTPLFLGGGDSSGLLELFDVDLLAGLLPGVYTGVFTTNGGLDGSANDDLSDVNFSIKVTSPTTTPEPGTLLLICGGLFVLVLARGHRNIGYVAR
jgi:hypothetical protein